MGKKRESDLQELIEHMAAMQHDISELKEAKGQWKPKKSG